jgi:hypothetical protein
VTTANIISHIGLVLDASDSMRQHRGRLVAAADSLIKHLATRSEELGQEVRISVWTFSTASRISCVVWDKDVLRLPSIAPYYEVGGMTALVDATMISVRDLQEIPERHGDHSHLLYVLTDGFENASWARPQQLRQVLAGLPGNWTVAALVPDDRRSLDAAVDYGFPAGNVERWDTASTEGATAVTSRIQETADAYMVGRSRGVRSTRTLFSTGVDAVNRDTVAAAGLQQLDPSTFVRADVGPVDRTIRDFVEGTLRRTFRTGNGFYELSKSVKIQSYKDVLVMERSTGRVYTGDAARDLLGLPAMDVTVSPTLNPLYKIFVQSTSTNRRLKAGTEFIYVK